MNKLEIWLLRRILKKAVRQGSQHQQLPRIFRLLREACAVEFIEDNAPTRDAFLREMLDANAARLEGELLAADAASTGSMLATSA